MINPLILFLLLENQDLMNSHAKTSHVMATAPVETLPTVSTAHLVCQGVLYFRATAIRPSSQLIEHVLHVSINN